MTEPRPVVSADEIHAYLVDQLNRALTHSEMFGGEAAFFLLIDNLLFMEGQPGSWRELFMEPFRERGAFSAIGVKGVFRELVRGTDSSGPASVYAEFVHQRGWLHTDRLIDARTHQTLLDRAPAWATQDREWPDVVAEFGEPSILFGGTNPKYGKTLAYVSEDPEHPMVFFHLWNGDLDEASPTWNPSYEQPVLWAVRLGDRPFQDSFTITPIGRQLRPQ